MFKADPVTVTPHERSYFSELISLHRQEADAAEFLSVLGLCTSHQSHYKDYESAAALEFVELRKECVSVGLKVISARNVAGDVSEVVVRAPMSK